MSTATPLQPEPMMTAEEQLRQELAAAYRELAEWREAVVAANRLSQEFEARAVRAEKIAAVAAEFGNPDPDCSCLQNRIGPAPSPCPHRLLAEAMGMRKTP